MRRLLALSLVIAALGALDGCGKSRPKVEDLKQLEKEACACKDQACAKAIDKQMSDLLLDVPPGEIDEKRGEVIDAIAACVTKQGVD